MLLSDLKSLLQSKNLWAKKKFGQNFLVDEPALNQILEAADLSSDDVVIEVGPGTGFLTQSLVAQVKHVTAVEMDGDMITILKERFKGVSNIEIIQSDILNFQIRKIKPYKVVANIPYYITSPLLKHFLQSDYSPTLMVLLVQKEVAEKICGMAGASLITIQTQVFGRPEIIAQIPRQSFYPQPKVDSSVLKIEVYKEPLVSQGQQKAFFRIVKFGFSQKRKKLANSLSAGLHKNPNEIRPMLEEIGLSPDVRAEELTIGNWEKLMTALRR